LRELIEWPISHPEIYQHLVRHSEWIRILSCQEGKLGRFWPRTDQKFPIESLLISSPYSSTPCCPRHGTHSAVTALLSFSLSLVHQFPHSSTHRKIPHSHSRRASNRRAVFCCTDRPAAANPYSHTPSQVPCQFVSVSFLLLLLARPLI
jgi:hypothetical protein